MRARLAMRSLAPCGPLLLSPVWPSAHLLLLKFGYTSHSTLYIRVHAHPSPGLANASYIAAVRGTHSNDRSSRGIHRESSASGLYGTGRRRGRWLRHPFSLIELVQRSAVLLQHPQKEPLPELAVGHVVPRLCPEERPAVSPHNAIVVVCTRITKRSAIPVDRGTVGES